MHPEIARKWEAEYKAPGGNIGAALAENALGIGGANNVANAVAENAFPSIANKVAQAKAAGVPKQEINKTCLLYTSPSPRDS